MARLQRVEFWGTKQFSQFGFVSLGQAGGTSPVVLNRFATIPFFAFTKQFQAFKSIGQAGGTSPPPSSGFQFLIHGPGITEQFVTGGRISAGGLSYTINPLSRRTV